MHGEQHRQHDKTSRVALWVAVAALYFAIMNALPTPSREPSVGVSRAVLPLENKAEPQLGQSPFKSGEFQR